MVSGYRFIFWGLILATFHINIGMLPILPVFVGYLNMAHGVRLIREEYSSPQLDKAYLITYLLAVLGIIGQVITWLGRSNDWIRLLPAAYGVLELFFMYYLLEGSMAFFHDNGREALEIEYKGKLSLFIATELLFIIAILIGSVMMNQGILLIASIAGVILRIWMMILVSGLKSEREDRSDEKNEEVQD